MSDLFTPPAIVKPSATRNERIATVKAMEESINRGRKMTLETVLEQGRELAAIKADCKTKEEWSEAQAKTGVPQQRISERLLFTSLPPAVISLCESVNDARRALKDHPPKKEDPEEPPKPDTSDLCDKCARMVKEGRRAYENCPRCAALKTSSKPKPPAPKAPPADKVEPKSEPAPDDSNPFMPRLDALDKRINETMDKIFKARELSSEDKTKARQLVKATTDVLKALSGAPIRPPQDQVCRDCGWDCQWVTTVGGGRILLEKEQSYSGRFDIIGGLAVSVQWVKGQKMYANHHMTCLKARKR